MQPDELYRILQQRPFQPVRIHVADGRVFVLRFRELAVVGVSWLDIGIPAPGETEPIYDYVVTIPLRDISRVERLAPASPSLPGSTDSTSS